MGDSDSEARKKGHGFRYEEQVIALVFLRCLRKELTDFTDFEVTSDSPDAGKFDDVIVSWRRNRKKCAMLVQLKHKTSKHATAVKWADLFSDGENKPDFNVRRYQNSYRSIEKGLRGKEYALVVSTNLPLHDNALASFDELETGSVLGAELLDTGGYIYELDPEENDYYPDFMERFFMFFNQKGVKEMKGDICEELKQLLGSPGQANIDNAYKELCKCVMSWKERQCTNPENLTSSWSEWKDIESRYKSSGCTIL